MAGAVVVVVVVVVVLVVVGQRVAHDAALVEHDPPLPHVHDAPAMLQLPIPPITGHQNPFPQKVQQLGCVVGAAVVVVIGVVVPPATVVTVAVVVAPPTHELLKS